VGTINSKACNNHLLTIAVVVLRTCL